MRSSAAQVQKDSQLSDHHKILLPSFLWSSTAVRYFSSARLVTLTLITLPNVASASGSFSHNHDFPMTVHFHLQFVLSSFQALLDRF